MATDPSFEGSKQSNVLVARPHFFKVIVFPSDQGLRIPIAFIRKHGDNLGKNVLLKVPTGESWKVELIRNDKGTWLQKGWQDFAEFYSIKIYHFLVFRYEGNSQFSVLIFDPTATEIEYPFDSTDGRHVNSSKTCKLGKKEEVESDDVSVEILEEISESKGSEGKRSEVDDVSIEILDDFPNYKKRKTKIGDALRNDHHSTEENGRRKVKLEKLDERDLRRSKRNIKKESYEESSWRSQSAVLKRQTALDEKKFESYQRAKAFKSKNPFFICFMQPSYVSKAPNLSISLEFTKEYLTRNKKFCYLMLCVAKGKMWQVKLTPGTSNSKVGRGWVKFVRDNGLKLGDTCVFELVGRKVFDIKIYRLNQA